MPKLSVITVNLNNKEGLSKTIESVLSQTFSDFEYIVIDGGSTDGSIDVIQKYKEGISYFVSERDKGIYNAMNKGILKASGEYLQFLNSGDWFVKNSILEEVFNRNYTEDILYGNAIFVNSSGESELYEVGYEEDITLGYFIKYSLCHQAAFIRKVLFNDGLYDENLRIVSDKKFFIEKIILKNCSIKKIRKEIVFYDLSGISLQKKHYELHQSERLKIIDQLIPVRIARDYLKLKPVIESTFFPYMPYLDNKIRLQAFISRTVSLIIRIHKFFSRLSRSKQ